MDAQLPSRPDFLPPGFGTVGHRDFVEIVVPAVVSYRPQTWGWAALAALIFSGLICVLYRSIRRYQKNAYRRAALSELAALRTLVESEREDAVRAVSPLIKRCALCVYPRTLVAPLSGTGWITFLEQSSPGAISQGAQEALLLLASRPPSEVPVALDGELFIAAEHWLRGHRA